MGTIIVEKTSEYDNYKTIGSIDTLYLNLDALNDADLWTYTYSR